jgi:hypothetical protein
MPDRSPSAHNPAPASVINEGFELISKRIEAISDRADRNIEGLSARMVEISGNVSDIRADQKIVLQQVRLTNGTVVKHEERITAIEKTAADKITVDAIRQQIHDAFTKRAVISKQVKTLWGVLLILLGAFAGAYFNRVIFK